MSRIALLPCALLTLALAACVPATPEGRIEAYPEMFQGLPDDQKQLVRAGRIERDMPPEAVFLAWGRPNREYAGADETSQTLRWDYHGSEPVTTTHLGFAYGRSRYRGPYGYYGPAYDYAFAPQVTYLPYLKAAVWFRDGRVTRWERSR